MRGDRQPLLSVIPHGTRMERHRQSLECGFAGHLLSGSVHLTQKREILVYVFYYFVDLVLADILVNDKEVGLGNGLDGPILAGIGSGFKDCTLPYRILGIDRIELDSVKLRILIPVEPRTA